MNNILNKDLKKYIDEKILPEYTAFDKAHGVKHINDVKNRSIEYFEELINSDEDLDINMVYTVACYHDLGMKIERKNHALHSSELLLADEALKQWFSGEELQTMADAVADHSTSSGHTPRSIYGMIVSDADKDRDPVLAIIRGIEFCIKNNPNFSPDEIAENVHSEIVRRFGGEDIGGKALVKFYISSAKNVEFLKELTAYAYDKEYYLKHFFEVYAEYLKNKPIASKTNN